jgi:hypothetical protein
MVDCLSKLNDAEKPSTDPDAPGSAAESAPAAPAGSAKP